MCGWAVSISCLYICSRCHITRAAWVPASPVASTIAVSPGRQHRNQLRACRTSCCEDIFTKLTWSWILVDMNLSFSASDRGEALPLMSREPNLIFVRTRFSPQFYLFLQSPFETDQNQCQNGIKIISLASSNANHIHAYSCYHIHCSLHDHISPCRLMNFLSSFQIIH